MNQSKRVLPKVGHKLEFDGMNKKKNAQFWPKFDRLNILGNLGMYQLKTFLGINWPNNKSQMGQSWPKARMFWAIWA